MSTKILCVDDDANILAGFQRNLRKQFSLDTAQGGAEALATIEKSGPYAVVVADMQMPGMNGIALLTKVQQIAPDTVRIMLTGNADQHTAMLAVNEGRVFQFLTKPCTPEVLAMALQAGLKQHNLITAEKELLERTLNGAIKTLTEILGTVDPHSFGHSQRLREYMRSYAQTRGQSNAWALEMAAMLCPIGFVAIPPAVLQKYRSELTLTPPEKDMITRVPQVGSDLIAGIPRLESVALNILYQAKNFDGSGFPTDSLAGENIPIGARILRVLNDLVLLERRDIPRTRAIETMQRQTGVYDSAVLQSVAEHFDIFIEKTTAAAPPREIPFRDLHAGMTLAADIRNRDDLLLVRAGTHISPMLMERLANFAQIGGIHEPVLIVG
jgi:response regulator RpfG family c-di-GMP phosphodiesterase